MAAIQVYPVERRAIGLGKETTPGTPVAMTTTVPCDKWAAEDKVTGLIDKSWRQSMAEEYAYIQGTTMADLTFGGPLYADTIGHLLLNLLGDYTVTGTAASPNSTLSSQVAAGATSITVASGAGFAANQWIQIGADAIGGAEIVQVQSVASNTITLTAVTPLRFGHASASAVTNTAAPYAHVFSLLNGPAAGGAQPPTHTFTDVSGVPSSSGARQYASGCLSEITLTLTAKQLVTWEAKGSAWLSNIAVAAPTVSPSAQPTQAAWNSTVGLGGPIGTNQTKIVDAAVFTLQRKLGNYWTLEGAQNPYIIARSGFSASSHLTFGPAADETALLDLLNNSQPQLQVKALGPNSTSIQVDAQIAAFDTSKYNDSKEAFGFDSTAKLIANTTNTGFSAGYSPLKITLTNATPTY